jgi:predicted MFS family arabinose efflux permease
MAPHSWRTPAVIMTCGGLIITLGMGVRHTFGLFLLPMSADLGWGREVFSFAIAVQNLVWGASQPLFGMVADRFGSARVLVCGAVLFIAGLTVMAFATTPAMLTLGAGVIIGLSLSGTTFSVVFGVVGRATTPEKRSMALGLVGAAGSFGQFVMVPFGQTLISAIGWFHALLVLAATALLMLPLSFALVEDRRTGAQESNQTIAQSLRQAFAHRGFWLLTLGYFVCGFQVVFIAVHLPSYLLDKGLNASVGMTALALIGLGNIVGTYACGALGGRYSKKYLLAGLYFMRSVVIALLLAFPVTPLSVYLFAGAMGVLWLGTVPLTNGLVAQIFGVKYLAMLSGFVFFSHQIGSFLGVWLGGYLFDRTGSYDVVWVICIALGVVAALLNLPIDERSAQQPNLKAAAA